MTNTFDTRGKQTGITYSGSHLSQTYVYSFSADTGLLASETINEQEFNSVVKRWKAGEITAVSAMKKLGLTKSTFYRKVREKQ